MLPKKDLVTHLIIEFCDIGAEEASEDGGQSILEGRAKLVISRRSDGLRKTTPGEDGGTASLGIAVLASTTQSDLKNAEAKASHTNQIFKQSDGQLHPDTFVNQRSGLLDKPTFLRLAREKAFPSKKVGKLIYARWGDVQKALAPVADEPPSTQQVPLPIVDPELDEIRSRVGLSVRGGSR